MICGVDEAGRGPWAGPVTAGAVILDPSQPIDGLTDSKKITEAAREALYPEIKVKAVAFGIGWASPAEVDQLNIREATFLAMTRAIAIMGLVPGELIIDGVENTVPLFNALLQEPDIQAGAYNIHWLEHWLETSFTA